MNLSVAKVWTKFKQWRSKEKQILKGDAENSKYRTVGMGFKSKYKTQKKKKLQKNTAFCKSLSLGVNELAASMTGPAL